MYINSQKQIWYSSGGIWYLIVVLRMINMKTLLLPIRKQQPSAYQPKQDPHVKFHGSQELLKKTS